MTEYCETMKLIPSALNNSNCIITVKHRFQRIDKIVWWLNPRIKGTQFQTRQRQNHKFILILFGVSFVLIHIFWVLYVLTTVSFVQQNIVYSECSVQWYIRWNVQNKGKITHTQAIYRIHNAQLFAYLTENCRQSAIRSDALRTHTFFTQPQANFTQTLGTTLSTKGKCSTMRTDCIIRHTVCVCVCIAGITNALR